MALRNHLRGSTYSVFSSDMKLRIVEDNAFSYPDIFVTCADSDRGQSHSKGDPVLIVHVRSLATSNFARGAKFAGYRKLSTLRKYALIEPERLGLGLGLFPREDGSEGNHKSTSEAPCQRWVPHPIGGRW